MTCITVVLGNTFRPVGQLWENLGIHQSDYWSRERPYLFAQSDIRAPSDALETELGIWDSHFLGQTAREIRKWSEIIELFILAFKVFQWENKYFLTERILTGSLTDFFAFDSVLFWVMKFRNLSIVNQWSKLAHAFYARPLWTYQIKISHNWPSIQASKVYTVDLTFFGSRKKVFTELPQIQLGIKLFPVQWIRSKIRRNFKDAAMF